MTRPARPLTCLAVGCAAAGLLSAGCTRAVSVPTAATARATDNPWPKADAALRKDADLAACRQALAQLNGDFALGGGDGQYLPPGPPPNFEAALRRDLHLTDAELDELRSRTFTNLDPNYLAECLYLRDAVRSLDPGGLPPARQAELAFAWVCRQLVLNPWVVRTGRGTAEQLPPVPPAYALRRGSGSGLERAFVFLAALRQLGLDGCLVGPPDAAVKGWAAPGPVANRPPKGPFWAVGARVGGDVFLFDPWRGEPLPGPAGATATLAQVTANPDVLKPWFGDTARPWDVTPEQVKAATPFGAVPLSALAPRMARLEKELTGPAPPRLVVDPAAVRARFAAEAHVPDLPFWNPTREPATTTELYTLTRLLGSFLPTAEGGTALDNGVLFNRYQQSAVPADFLAMLQAEQTPPELLARVVPARFAAAAPDLMPGPNDIGVPEAVRRIGEYATGAFVQAFLTAPTPRERIQRGQFAEVAPALVDARKRFDTARDRARTDTQRADLIRPWSEKAKELYTALGRARGSAAPGAAAAAQQAVDSFWKSEQIGTTALVDVVVAEPGLAEATFLLAQCMNEQAERASARLARPPADGRPADPAARDRAADAWAEAKGWWAKYEPFAAAQDQAFPGRAAHARHLAERAAKQAADLGRGR